MKQNKVAVNLAQDFTDAEKAQARQNIGAADGKISWVEYHEGAPQPTVTKSGLSVVNSDRGVRIQNDDASVEYFVAPAPVSGDNGKVLGVTQVGSVGWVVPPTPSVSGDKFDICQQLLAYNASNTTVLDKMFIGNNYKEYAGNIGFTTTSSGNMSICAFDANEQLIYGNQCVNFSGPSTGTTNFIPFTFKESGNERISFIGIKGTSNGNADITHLFYIGKKE